jgi:hypothetical protein
MARRISVTHLPIASIGLDFDLEQLRRTLLAFCAAMSRRLSRLTGSSAKALQLKGRFPMLQVKVYDAVERIRISIDDPEDRAG